MNNFATNEESKGGFSLARKIRDGISSLLKDKTAEEFKDQINVEYDTKNALSYFNEGKYSKAISLCDSILEKEPYNGVALEIKLVSSYKGIIEKSNGFDKFEISENEWRTIIKSIKKQVPNEKYLKHLAKLIYYYIKEDKILSMHILKIYPDLISTVTDFQSELIEILAKDSEKNKNEAYLTTIHTF